MIFKSFINKIVLIGILIFSAGCCSFVNAQPFLNHQVIAKKYFQEDAKWYMDNIPFFECSDKQLEHVYYYRWKMYKAHIRSVGKNQYVITEFINHVPWDREPYCTINAAAMHHIYEGRWLKDDRYMNGYINNLYQQGGNDRRYSESVADAVFARCLVNADRGFLTQQLESMKGTYNAWADHFDSAKNLYYIPAMPDATEYTVASIDASGGEAGFDGGDAFRPTINSYMYGNAMAIALTAEMNGDKATASEYFERAASLKQTVQDSLWNPVLLHFMDRFKQDNQYVHYWDFIRSRELAGLAPWYFGLPADDRKFGIAWRQLTDTSRLLGKYGMRTNEPSYEYYFKQIVYFEGKRGSQWNGPSWPYQTSMMLTGMANLLNDYEQHSITKSDYIKVLHQYALQHYLPDGKINLVENYDPDLGGPIVHYYWSNHYNHSTFNNLIITGLCGIRPSASDTLEINPLADELVRYFVLDNVRYHGHRITVIYDKDGQKYKQGKGLTVFVDGKKREAISKSGRYFILVGKPVLHPVAEELENYALNIKKIGYPKPSASVNNIADSLNQAVDGRIWYFPEISNHWSTVGSKAQYDWLAVDFGQIRSISAIKIYPVVDTETFSLPDNYTIEYQNGEKVWKMLKFQRSPKLIGNTSNTIVFNKIDARCIKINFKHNKKQIAISELQCF